MLYVFWFLFFFCRYNTYKHIQTQMERFAIIISGFKPLTIFGKSSIVEMFDRVLQSPSNFVPLLFGNSEY